MNVDSYYERYSHGLKLTIQWVYMCQNVYLSLIDMFYMGTLKKYFWFFPTSNIVKFWMKNNLILLPSLQILDISTKT